MPSIRSVLADAQYSNHKSLVPKLKSFEAEAGFEADLQDCILRLLNVPKAQPLRVLEVLTIYLSSSSYASSILVSLIPYLSAKDKGIRYRATHIIAKLLNNLTAIDDDVYLEVRHELVKKLHDKIPAVRLEVVKALSPLLENELDDEGYEDAPSLLDNLIDVLQNDTNAAVRRTLLLNLPLIPKTLPYLLERARDRDDSIRLVVFDRILPQLLDFRHLSVSIREKLLRWGLRDPDEKTRKAAARMFREHWLEDCAGSKDSPGKDLPKKTLSPPQISALFELLERIDLINTGASGGVALEAMKQLWDGRPDYLDAVEFDDEFWTDLTPESAFVVRTFSEFCHKNEAYQAMFDEKMPEVSRLGFYLQQQTNILLESAKESTEEGVEKEDLVEREFIVEQLLVVAQHLDYSDELGRRKMFSLLRETLAIPELPEGVIEPIVQALRATIASDDNEFCRVVLESIAELPDVRCLYIVKAMLLCIETIQESILASTLDHLIIPAVRSRHVPIRELGLTCLALACLLDEDLAKNNIRLFEHCAANGDESLQTISIKALSDVGMMYPSLVNEKSFELELAPTLSRLAKLSMTKMLLVSGEVEEEKIPST